MHAPATLTLSIPNRIDDLAGGLDEVETFLSGQQIDAGDSAQVMIMLDEIGSNIIKSAWPGGGEHRFEIELRIDADSLLMFLAVDDGVAFDPTDAGAPDLDASLDDREPGGLGLFMVGELSDSMEYSRVEGQNRLMVTKRLQRAG